MVQASKIGPKESTSQATRPVLTEQIGLGRSSCLPHWRRLWQAFAKMARSKQQRLMSFDACFLQALMAKMLIIENNPEVVYIRVEAHLHQQLGREVSFSGSFLLHRKLALLRDIRFY